MKNKPLTIKEALKYGQSLLQGSPTLISNPQLECEVLLANILNKDKAFLFAHDNDTLTPNQQECFQKYLELRIAKHPISQIIGYKEFYSRNFYVNKHVLTPRPETEILVEEVLKVLISLPKNSEINIADFGTGSGCIAISLALEVKQAHLNIFAYDNSEEALNIANKNWQSLQQKDTINMIEFSKIDLLNCSPERIFDIIVSNPPYIPSTNTNEVAQDVLGFEPDQALFSGIDGMDFYRRIKTIAKTALKSRGYIFLEAYSPNAKKIRAIFADEYSSNIINDYSGKPRIIRLQKNV